MAHALANNFAVESSPQDFDLSRNKFLRRLKFPACSIDGSSRTTVFLKHLLSAITHSAVLRISLLQGECCLSGVKSWHSEWPKLSTAERGKEVSWYHQQFRVLREMHKVRASQLVLCASSWGRFEEEPVRILEDAIAEERAKGGFDGFPCEPSVMYHPQEFRQGLYRSFLF